MRDRDAPRAEPHSTRTCSRQRLRYRPAHNRRRPPGSSARSNPPAPHRSQLGQTETGASPGAFFPSAYSSGAALSGIANPPDDPAAVLQMVEAVGRFHSQSGRIPASHPFTLAVFPPGAAGSDVSVPSSFACRPPATGHSPRRSFKPGVPVPAGRVCAAWSRKRGQTPLVRTLFRSSAHGIQPFAALFRPVSSASVVRRGGPRVVCLFHPPRWFWSRYRPRKLLRTRPRPMGMSQVRLPGIDPSGQPSASCRREADSCCPGLCLFRALGRPAAQRGGRISARAHRPSPDPFPAALRSWASATFSSSAGTPLVRRTRTGLAACSSAIQAANALLLRHQRDPAPDELPV